MRKIIFHLSTGFAGMDSTENGLFPDNVTDDELNEEAWRRALNHAESYGIYPQSWLEDYLDEELAEISEDDYSDDIEGSWEDYDSYRHDGLSVGGGWYVSSYV